MAQAQDEINVRGGINSVPLKVAIANDNNDPEIAKKLAPSFAENQDIYKTHVFTKGSLSFRVYSLGYSFHCLIF